jgi:hypothetical protein
VREAAVYPTTAAPAMIAACAARICTDCGNFNWSPRTGGRHFLPCLMSAAQRSCATIIVWSAGIVGIAASAGRAGSAGAEEPSAQHGAGLPGQARIAYIPIEGLIDRGKAAYLKRVIGVAIGDKVDCILIHLTTDGGSSAPPSTWPTPC